MLCHLLVLLLPALLAAVRPADISPTPLIRLMNSSYVASLEQQLATANASSFISNISLSDWQNDNDTRHLQIRYRERKKQERLYLIQAQILQRLRIARKPNTTSPVLSRQERRRMSQLYERVRHLHVPTHSNEVYAERFQSFYPSCAIPNGTERSLWEQSETFRLFYDINFPLHSEGTENTVVSAKLRLFKYQAQEIMSNCIECSRTVPESYPRFLLPTVSPAAIIVSVFQFIKPLRPHRREKKRLVDSKSVGIDVQGWVEFNLAPTINHWMQNRHKNFGLEIEVEDMFGSKQNANLFFRNMNCTEHAAQESPFPNLLDIHPEMAINESVFFENVTYPTLDLQTAELTRETTTSDPPEGSEMRLLRKRHAGHLYLSPIWKRSCRREEIFVTFKELGLDDVVIEPEGFHIAYCAGACHRRRKRFACVADTFDPVDVVYLDKEGVTRDATLNDLSAKSCFCAKL